MSGLREVTKQQLGGKIQQAADDYWRLKKDHGLPDEYETAVKFAFIKGWTESEKNRKSN